MNLYKTSKDWQYNRVSYFVGGTFFVNNSSEGYHGILKQWWDHYKIDRAKWLLISETNMQKSYFEKDYPNDLFYTLEYYADESMVDYNLNLCDRNFISLNQKFNIILSQATLEHVYDPFTAMLNMVNLLDNDGILLIHTHTKDMYYHPYPRDYFRFFADWFIDIPKHLPVELLELVDVDEHFFAAYKKIN